MPTTTETIPSTPSPSELEAIDLLNAFSDALDNASAEKQEADLEADLAAYNDALQLRETVKNSSGVDLTKEQLAHTRDKILQTLTTIDSDTDKRGVLEMRGECQLLDSVSRQIDVDEPDYDGVVAYYLTLARGAEVVNNRYTDPMVQKAFEDFVDLVKRIKDEAFAHIIVAKYPETIV